MSNDTNRTGPTEARREAETMAEDARKAGQQAYDTVKDEAGRQTERAQGRVASEAGNVADALRRAAEESRDGSAQERTFSQIADMMADVSDGIRDKDLSELMGDANDFARRNPVAFLGGAALLGFADARFAKASSEPKNYGSHGSNDYGRADAGRHADAAGDAQPLPPRDPVPVAAPNPSGRPGGSDFGGTDR